MSQIVHMPDYKLYEPIPVVPDNDTWRRILRQKHKLDKSNPSGGLCYWQCQTYDLAGPMLDRRMDAILATIQRVLDIEPGHSKFAPNSVGGNWIALNLGMRAHEYFEPQYHIFCAAALWVIANSDPEKLAKAVENAPIGSMPELPFQPASCSREAVLRVMSVLINRRGPINTLEGESYLQSGKSLDASKRHANPAFDALMEAVNPDSLHLARARFAAAFWRWTEEFLKECSIFDAKIDEKLNIANEGRMAFNKYKNSLRGEYSPMSTPLEAITADAKLSVYSKVLDESRHKKLCDLDDQVNADNRAYMQVVDARSGFIAGCLEPMNNEVPVQVFDPFETCFAAISMIEENNDLAWLYGPFFNVLDRAATYLPWYSEDEESCLDDEEEEPEEFFDVVDARKNVYEQTFHLKSDNLPCSLSQIIFDHTGIVLDEAAMRQTKSVASHYSLRGNSAKILDAMIAELSAIQTHLETSSFSSCSVDDDAASETVEEPDDDKVDVAALEQQIRELKAANKQLRQECNAAEKSAKEAKRALEAERTRSAAVAREMADMRDLIFLNQLDATEPEQPEARTFPYTVSKETRIFGGHDTWLTAIKPLLKGNVRFVDKDFQFGDNVIRNADVIWIQTNAIGHSQYYRVIDQAKLYNKQIRYFTFASAVKCAEQLAENDEETA